MPYQTRLPEALAARGLQVEVVPGWSTRGSSNFNPRGSVSHWTAGPRTGDRPSLNVCTYGRAGLAGPLCNVFLTRSGVAIVVAAGRANHAGLGGAGGLLGNSSVFGTEAESSGDGNWTDEQLVAYPKINAAYVDLGASRNHVYGHFEWAPTRKIDIRDIMHRVRADTYRLLDGGSVDTRPAPVAPPTPAPPIPADRLTVDGVLGTATMRELQQSLNNTGANPRLAVDGWFGGWSKQYLPNLGRSTTRALQARLNHTNQPDRVTIDGVLGPQTIRALQLRLNHFEVTAGRAGLDWDGLWGAATTRALQRRLNEGEL